MLHALEPYLKRPSLYERTEEAFWDDEHISSHMLEAHLNPGTDAASRKPEFIGQSVLWIASLLKEGNTLLDLGCGPGFYTKPLSQMGFSVIGMDISKRSIEYAKSQDALSEYILQSYLEMDYEECFDMATLIWCDYGALTDIERMQLLEKVYTSLRPGGHLLLDVFTPAFLQETQESTSWSYHSKGGFWNAAQHLCLSAQYMYDKNILLNRTLVATRNAVHEYNIWNTCFAYDALVKEAMAGGFVVEYVFDNIAGAPYTGKKDTMCILLQKIEGER